MTRALPAMVVVLALAALAAPAAARVPPPLSADRSPPEVSSRFGSGNFGRWSVDELGLPFFRYELDHLSDPRAQQPELSGATRAQHQLGNDHIVATAWNDGYTQLWSQDRLPQWANAYEPDRRHYAGGYGYLNLDGEVLSSFWEDRPQAGPSIATSASATTASACGRRASRCATRSTRPSATIRCSCTT